jgi:hypothetical protein
VAEKTAVSGESTATFTGSASRRWLASLRQWLRSALFRQTASGPIGWRKITLAVVLVAAGAAVSLARTGGAGALNTTWIEDAKVFLNQALNEPVLKTITSQYNGYYNVVPRLATALAVVFPLRWAPAVMSGFAALEYATFGLVAYIASGPHLRSRWLRLLIAIPACVIPLGYTQANNDLATVQFVALYGTFWLLLWLPGTRAGRVLSPVIMLGVTLTSILPLVFAPLALARLFVDRSKNAIALFTCYGFGLVVQESVSLRGLSNRPSNWYTSPLWVIKMYVSRAVPRSIFGEKALGGPGTDFSGNPVPLHIVSQAEHLALISAAWIVVAAVVLIAFARVTDPNWPLAITAGLFSVLVFLSEIVDNLTIVQPRYVIAPALLLYAAIVAMLRPRGVMQAAPSADAGESAPAAQSAEPAGSAQPAGSGSGTPGRRAGVRPVLTWCPVAVFAILLAVACVFNYRVTTNSRSMSPAWSGVVAKAAASCEKPGVTSYHFAYQWWYVQIPCSRVPSSSAG